MSPSRVKALLLAGILAMAAAVVATPAAAADSPVRAVEVLVDKVQRGEFDTLDEVVCAAREEAVRARFDLGSELASTVGLEADAFSDAVSISISDPSTELISESADVAAVRLRATMTRSIDPGAARDWVRALADELDDEALSETELDDLTAAMLASFSTPEQLDESFTMLRRDGAWLVCDDGSSLDGGPADLSPTVSFDGLCGLVTIDDVNRLGTFSYDSSFGTDDSCSYSSSATGADHSISLSVDGAATLAEYEALYGEGEAVTLAGLPGFLEGDSVYLELPDGGVFVASLSLDTPLAADARAHLNAFAELLAPRVSAADGFTEADLVGDVPVGADSLCSLLDFEALDGLGPLRYTELFDGGSGLCVYSSDLDDDGYHTLSIYRDVFTIEDLGLIYPDGEASVVRGVPAYSDATTLWIDIGDEGGTIAISPLFEDAPAAEGMDHLAYAAKVGELLIEAIADEG